LPPDADQAATDVFHRYEGRLVALARSRLSARLAQRIDPEDVVQSAYRSFFTEIHDGTYDVRPGADLWQLLATITLHKLQRQVQRHSAQKRAVQREEHFGSEDTLLRMQAHLSAPGPSPMEAASLVDEMEQLLLRFDDSERSILELRLQGYTLDEVARQVGCTERTVRRILDRIKSHLERWLVERSEP
jgi:RNA polymerase sigma-70 factor (ECF subfamily)